MVMKASSPEAHVPPNVTFTEWNFPPRRTRLFQKKTPA